MGFLRSRVVLGIAGFIVFGILGALAVTTPLHFGTNTTADIQGTITSTPRASQATEIAQSAISPTAVPPTRIIVPTDTPSNSPTTLNGTIGTLGTNSFTLNESTGGTITVVVGSSTQYQNVSGFSGLSTGMSATVTGRVLFNGHFRAAIVHINIDN